MSKDRNGTPRFVDELANEIIQTMKLATQALDGFDLSDEELDELCEAVLAKDISLKLHSGVRAGRVSIV